MVLASLSVGRAVMVDPVTLADCATPVSMAAPVPAVMVTQGEDRGGFIGQGTCRSESPLPWSTSRGVFLLCKLKTNMSWIPSE